VDTEYKEWIQNIRRGYKRQGVDTEYKGWIQNTRSGYRIQGVDTEYKEWIQNIRNGYRKQGVDTEGKEWIQKILLTLRYSSSSYIEYTILDLSPFTTFSFREATVSGGGVWRSESIPFHSAPECVVLSI